MNKLGKDCSIAANASLAGFGLINSFLPSADNLCNSMNPDLDRQKLNSHERFFLEGF